MNKAFYDQEYQHLSVEVWNSTGNFFFDMMHLHPQSSPVLFFILSIFGIISKHPKSAAERELLSTVDAGSGGGGGSC